MGKWAGTIILWAALGGTATAQAAPEPEFSAERVKAHVAFLADDLLEGRNTGQRGYDLAALYVASQYAALGLRSANGESWFQPITFQNTSLDGPGPSLTVGTRRFANKSDALIFPSARGPLPTGELDAVFVGYGLHAPDLGVDDYRGLDVRDKLVVVLSGFPVGMASDIGAHLASDRALAAERHGAVGMITIQTPRSLKSFPWKRMAAYVDVPTLNWIGRDGRPDVEAPRIKLGGLVTGAAAEELFRGASRPLSAIIAESEKEGGRPKGFPLRQTVKLERSTKAKQFASSNVVAMLPGSDPALANEYVLLMAHLDHDGVDPSLPGEDKIYNGAMDNAAGIATMLEAARALAASPNRPRRSILFAAVTAEEDGLLGAEYLAKNPVIGDGKVVAVVNLDMPILTYDFEDVVAFGAEHSTLGPIVERAAARDKVALSPDPMPEEGLFTRSDHYMFVREGIPSVFLVTGHGGPGKAASEEFVGKHYHRVTDDMKLPVDWRVGAKFARINYLIAREIADAPAAPLWCQDSFFGKMFAKDRPKAQRPR